MQTVLRPRAGRSAERDAVEALRAGRRGALRAAASGRRPALSRGHPRAGRAEAAARRSRARSRLRLRGRDAERGHRRGRRLPGHARTRRGAPAIPAASPPSCPLATAVRERVPVFVARGRPGTVRSRRCRSSSALEQTTTSSGRSRSPSPRRTSSTTDERAFLQAFARECAAGARAGAAVRGGARRAPRRAAGARGHPARGRYPRSARRGSSGTTCARRSPRSGCRSRSCSSAEASPKIRCGRSRGSRPRRSG